MRGRILVLICVGLVASVIVWGAPRQNAGSRVTWEYKVVWEQKDKVTKAKIHEWAFDEKQMNDLGAQGWELTGVVSDGTIGRSYSFFKRPKP